MMATWRAQFKIKPVCEAITGFRDEVRFDNYTLRFDERNKVIICEVVKELDTEDYSQACEYITRDVEENLMPLLMLSMNCGLELNPNDVSLVLESREKRIVVSNIITVHVYSVLSEDTNTFTKRLNNLKGGFEELEEERRQWFLRAMRFLNKGLVETDPVDKFLNAYIAFEILAKRVLNVKGNHYEIAKDVEKMFGSKCGAKLKYDEYYVNTIRNTLLHGESKIGDKKLGGDEAVELAKRHADEFARNVLKLVKCALEIS